MKKIAKIKNGFWSRQISMAKMVLKTGPQIFFAEENDYKEKILGLLEKNVGHFTNELGLMKGSIMKAGQMLSLHAGPYLSPEALKILKTLENQSHYLDWEVIKKQIPTSWFHDLEISPTPIAAASLGQVHLAKNKRSQEIYAMKIQYEGVRKAIDNDLKMLQWLMKALNLLPQELDTTEIFREVKEMLLTETDYIAEKRSTQQFQEILKDYPYYKTTEVIEKYSNDSILTTQYLEGFSLRSPEVQNLSQEKRNFLGESFLRLFFIEIFHLGLVQTDAHMGNFLILNSANSDYSDNKPLWGLIDFGASKQPPSDFLKGYQNLIKSCALLDSSLFFETLHKMGYLVHNHHSDPRSFSIDEEATNLWKYACILGEPFKGGLYDWGKSPIQDQTLEFLPQLLRKVKIGNPPRHALFLDRKLSGVFFILKELRSQFDPKLVFEEFL